ncbi:glycosyltransferase [Acaryochloris sp. 'Moss Beach']|uniref:glycosyltransferase family protein n=1 Tax=Acaryochloris sp. 'Moss Beach' TaxID=2740837 RepID=UPI001F1E5122|nr:glycosyltransferase [Acaryochloris sp. 'Moss Beach']UJB67905.1 glycosyltransferase [Acaryochloris sp. 'Moss Beach']
MRLTLFWSYYQGYIQSIYSAYSGLEQKSYQDQLSVFLSDHFGWLPALAKRLESLGHEVQILIVNSKPLQRRWAEENGVDFKQKNWQYEIAYEQVKDFQPDILWIGSMFTYFGEYLQRLKPLCRKIFAWIACPSPNSLNLSGVDCVLTSHANFQNSFQRQGQASERVLPAFEPNILDRSNNNVQKNVACSFVGNLSWAHLKRIQVIRELTEYTPLQIWGDLPRLRSRGLLSKGFISAYFTARSVKSRVSASVWGMNMYDVLAQSAMTVNVHGEIAEGIAGNMRMFEATGIGVLLLTEDAPNIKELFEPNVEIVTYTSTSHLIDKITYYIKHPKECSEIAQAGQQKTLSAHNTVCRAHEVLAIFDKYLNSSS